MARNQSPAFFTVALLLLAAAAAPLALAQAPSMPLLTPGPITVLDAIRITGALCCSPTGICIGGPGIGGVNFTMSCRTGILGSGTGSLIVAQGTTTATGEFTIILTSIAALLKALGITVAGLLAGKFPFQILIALPISQAICPALSAVNGHLAAALSPVGTTISRELGIILDVALSLDRILL